MSLDARHIVGHTVLYLSTTSDHPRDDVYRVHARQCMVQNITVNDRPADFSYHDYLSGRVFRKHGGGAAGGGNSKGSKKEKATAATFNPNPNLSRAAAARAIVQHHALAAREKIRHDEAERMGGHLLRTSLVPDNNPDVVPETYQARDLLTFHAAYSAAQHEAERGEIVLDMSSLPRGGRVSFGVAESDKGFAGVDVVLLETTAADVDALLAAGCLAPRGLAAMAIDDVADDGARGASAAGVADDDGDDDAEMTATTPDASFVFAPPTFDHVAADAAVVVPEDDSGVVPVDPGEDDVDDLPPEPPARPVTP